MSRVVLSLMSVTSLLIGCNNTLPPGEIQGEDVMAHSPISLPSSPSTESTENLKPSTTPTTIGSTCSSKDGQSFCVALKYVVYKDGNGRPLVSDQTAIKNLKTMNEIWSQCQIAFQIDEYLAVDPNQYGLRYNTADGSELDQIRKIFDDQATFLLVTTGTWDRDGTLGNTGANAWAAMPGDDFFGVVLEAPIKTNANILAHELGHYMNLSHADDTSNLMSPIIYDSSLEITQRQCRAARSALKAFWRKMLH